MVENKEWLTQRILDSYKQNPYVNLLDINLEKLDEGHAELSMLIVNKHTNLYNIAHGGALASFADTCMGVACATTGKKVVTLEMNMNFIKGAVPQLELRGIGEIIHNGKSTIVAEGKILDSQNNMIATARGTFYVTGLFEEITAS